MWDTPQVLRAPQAHRWRCFLKQHNTHDMSEGHYVSANVVTAQAEPCGNTHTQTTPCYQGMFVTQRMMYMYTALTQ